MDDDAAGRSVAGNQTMKLTLTLLAALLLAAKSP